MNNYSLQKTEYLPNVSGFRIVERQQEINSDINKWVKATQIFPIVGANGNPVFSKREDGKLYRAYDAFIYYGEKPVDEGKLQDTNIEIESDNSIDIVIPQ